jgi:hypothetical protein
MSCPTSSMSWCATRNTSPGSRAGPPSIPRRERTAYMFPIPGIETALKVYEIFGNAIYQGYGQTELLPVAMLEPPQ